MADYSGYTRRQELTCSLADLTTYGDRVLLEHELIYVDMGDGTYDIKIGDGKTAVKDLPYVIDYQAINQAKQSAQASVTECQTILSPVETSASSVFASEGLLDDDE